MYVKVQLKLSGDNIPRIIFKHLHHTRIPVTRISYSRFEIMQQILCLLAFF